ncbi:hypothetical protein K488DRAFT_89641 [Vararia minispora EC-137]|uniref:Uncharacterized protein n=1 Tax=Vararia minispora EC-137 TaxID=1314806 RepID=A0ACB8Q9U8_9AGAM|nr:hypothetical protein K488DRAFT_89641 [Vararia minispora EC-137]
MVLDLHDEKLRKSGSVVADEKDTDFSSKGDVETTSEGSTAVLESERDIVTHVISIDDDPLLSPWTFRAFFLGIGLSAFGGVLAHRLMVAHSPH